MDNKVLAEMIREKYYEEKMSAEYKLQLNKVVEMEDKFLKNFSKDKWKEYLYLDIEKGQLHSIEVDLSYFYYTNHSIYFLSDIDLI